MHKKITVKVNMSDNIIKVECGACPRFIYIRKQDLETINSYLKDDKRHEHLSLLCSKCWHLIRKIPLGKLKICQRVHKINLKSQNIMSIDAEFIKDEKILILEVQ